jgi:hemerythrin superfamily protein
MATQRKKQSAPAARRRNGTGEAVGATTMLREDHRSVEKLFREFEAEESGDRKAELARRACNELVVHAMLEEEIFYPACREIEALAGALDEAQVEHDTVKLLIRDVLARSPGDPYYDARVKVLSEYVKHHVAEEEKPDGGVFAQARTARLDMKALGERLQARKAELMEQAESGRLPAPVPLSLAPSDTTDQDNQEKPTMQRERDRDRNGGRGSRADEQERDEYGRFMREDDRESSRGRGERTARMEEDDDRRGSWSRGRGGGYQEREQEFQGRFMSDDRRESEGEGRGWHGDPRGHAEAARRGWEERDDRSSRSREDEGSWRGRDDDRSRRGREEDDDRRGSQQGRGEGQGEGRGWHGDPRGHAEAARRGWEERDDRSSRSREDEGSWRSREDDRSRRGREEDDDRRGSQQGRGEGRGWHGDPEGHAEAARRRWEDQGGSRSSRGRDDDDRRGSRSGR